MADVGNNDAAFGIVPFKFRNNRPYAGEGNWYYVPSSDTTALYIGDPVTIAGAADTYGNFATVGIATAAGGAYIAGFVVGVAPIKASGGHFVDNSDLTLSKIYRPASTAMYVFVADDPDLVFLAQEDSVGSTLAATSAGLNVDLIAGTGSPVTGKSGWELDSSTANTTNTLQMRLHRVHDRVDNLLGDQAIWEVTMNLNSQRYTTGV